MVAGGGGGGWRRQAVGRNIVMEAGGARHISSRWHIHVDLIMEHFGQKFAPRGFAKVGLKL